MVIQVLEGQKVWFTSDTHYGHTNIVRGITIWKDAQDKTRDFKTLYEHNLAIVTGINSVVGEDDILIHMGDWSFGGIENIWEFRKQIQCKNIHLFLGNHDHHIKNNKSLPNVCSDQYEGINGILFDENVAESGNINRFIIGARILFTSVNTVDFIDIRMEQTKGQRASGEKKTKYRFVGYHHPIVSWDEMSQGRMHLFGHCHLPPHKKIMPGRSMDVGVDGNNLKPYQLSEIIKLLEDRPIKSLLPFDHHSKEVI